MIFYLVIGGLFALYGIELLVMVVISALAQRREARAAAAAKKSSSSSAAAAKTVEAAAALPATPSSCSPPSTPSLSSTQEHAVIAPLAREQHCTHTNSMEPASRASEGGAVSEWSSRFSHSTASLSTSGASELSSDDVIVDIGIQKGDGPAKPAGHAEPQSISFVIGKGNSSNQLDGVITKWPRPIHEYPMVLIQVPMYNEEAHADIVVHRCCAIQWPRTRLLIQVLDDSTKAHIRDKVDAAAAKCMEDGHPVQVLRRTNRQGYKAGAMAEALEGLPPNTYKYCAIFDADFEPPSDFLLETIGPLESNPKLGFVQTRWQCASNSLLTWAQKVSLDFHFDVEQRARSACGWFFNFNGTAGVWRIQAIQEAGGWESDTVVEDMDLSLRAYLAGWGGKYLPHIHVPNELPSDLSTYKTQQYRWLCGPMQIIHKAFWHIWSAKHMPLSKRLNCYWFFARYVLFALMTLAVLAVPPVALWLDPWRWTWYTIFYCATVNFAMAVWLYVTPFSLFHMIFSMGTGYFKAWAMLGGLVGSQKSKSWKVTVKKGNTGAAQPTVAIVVAADGDDSSATQEPPVKPSLCQRMKAGLVNFKQAITSIQAPYALEMGLAVYHAAIAGLSFAAVGLPHGPNWIMGAYCAASTVVFMAFSFGDSFL